MQVYEVASGALSMEFIDAAMHRRSDAQISEEMVTLSSLVVISAARQAFGCQDVQILHLALDVWMAKLSS